MTTIIQLLIILGAAIMVTNSRCTSATSPSVCLHMSVYPQWI